LSNDGSLARALALVRDLRARCPWDRAQTAATLRPYLIEEVLELDQALRDGDAAAVCDELGDLLLHLAFQIVLAEEARVFDAEAVTRGLEQKMQRRHPHLFGAVERDPLTWERVKRREQDAARGALSGLPRSLHALLLAFRLQERAAGVGFDWPDARGPRDKVKEELDELERASAAGRREAIVDEVGDLLFAVVNLARKLDVDPRAALERANDKFQRRFAALERLAAERGVAVGKATLAELDQLWEEVKAGRAPG
jgi:nucleoside triphosphate diphosphatase